MPDRDAFAELVGQVVADGGSSWADGADLPTDDVLFCSMEMLAPGELPAVDGYDLIAEVGRGGQAVVYRATERATGRAVAIKALPGGHLADRRSRARFVRETRIVSRLDHPGIVPALRSTRTAKGSLCLVMPFVDGRPLDVAAAGLSDREIARLFAAVADVVAAVHRAGVVHRDLKPHNVLVDVAGQPFLLDFGLAGSDVSADRSRSLTAPLQVLGSLPWASPEQARGDTAAVDARSDVYSLGVMLCRAIAAGNAPPYRTDGPAYDVTARIVGARPVVAGRRRADPLAIVTLTCLAKRPAARYPTAAALAEDLGRVAAGRPPLGTAARRRRWPPALAVVAVGVTVALAVARRPAHVPPVRRAAATGTLASIPVYGLAPAPGSGRASAARSPVTAGQLAAILRRPTVGDPAGPAAVDLPTALAACRAAGDREGRRVRLPTAAELGAAVRLWPSDAAGRHSPEWTAGDAAVRPGAVRTGETRAFRLAVDD